MTKTVLGILAAAVIVLLWRWWHVWHSNRLDNQAFEYRMRNRLDLK